MDSLEGSGGDSTSRQASGAPQPDLGREFFVSVLVVFVVVIGIVLLAKSFGGKGAGSPAAVAGKAAAAFSPWFPVR